MALNLSNLIGQLVGSNAEVPNPEDTIVVEGGRGVPPPVDMRGQEPPFLGNEDFRYEAKTATGQPMEHTGMFGTRGTLRDILGGFSDAFDPNRGNNNQPGRYATQRNRERLSDAMIGLTNGPEAALAAIERVAAVDPAAAQEMYNQVQEQQARTQQLATQQAGVDNLEAQRLSTRKDRARETIARMLATPGAISDGMITPAALARAQQIAAAEGVSLEQMGVEAGMTEEEARLLSGSDLSVYQTVNQPLNEQRVVNSTANVGINQQNADTNARRAAQPRATPNPTQASELARIRATVNAGEPLAPGDRQTWDRAMQEADDNAPRFGQPAAPAPSGLRIRPVTPR